MSPYLRMGPVHTKVRAITRKHEYARAHTGIDNTGAHACTHTRSHGCSTSPARGGNSNPASTALGTLHCMHSCLMVRTTALGWHWPDIDTYSHLRIPLGVGPGGTLQSTRPLSRTAADPTYYGQTVGRHRPVLNGTHVFIFILMRHWPVTAVSPVALTAGRLHEKWCYISTP